MCIRDRSSTVTVNVARTEEEAERQSKGEDVTIEKIEEEEIMLQAEEVFEEGADVNLSDKTESEDTPKVEAATETKDDSEAESAEEITPEEDEDSTE